MTTETQEKIREMYHQKTNIQDIASSLNVSKRYVYKVLGSIGIHLSSPTVHNPYLTLSSHGKYRLHACHFVIHIISSGHRFPKLKFNIGYVDGHRFEIHGNGTVALYQKEGDQFSASIYADDLAELQSISSTYWNGIIWRLQRRLDCLLLKEGFPSFKEARSHIAYIDEQGVAQKVILEYGKGLYIHNYQGKAIMIFDMSHGKYEREYIAGHGENMQHAVKVEPYINSICYDPHYTPSQVKASIDALTVALQETARQTSFVAANAATHFPLLISMKKELAKLRKNTDRAIQKGLGGWM